MTDAGSTPPQRPARSASTAPPPPWRSTAATAAFFGAPALLLRSLASDPDRRAITTADGAVIIAGDFTAATYRLATNSSPGARPAAPP
ncbi:hypothetical protein [Streptomyces botrytidirepellens]|uniref:hypothetical protein n=1 Tax=Streptomyces botrytidirepellens TaxID=2486417 RepID=UPI0011CE6EEC|nr:hypothetical protein [Streptomyces botrytidirepellens]